jgi:hypothetical protein
VADGEAGLPGPAGPDQSDQTRSAREAPPELVERRAPADERIALGREDVPRRSTDGEVARERGGDFLGAPEALARLAREAAPDRLLPAFVQIAHQDSAGSYTNGESQEGRAFVYHGSASGLQASPAWTAESDQPGANFGLSVATAGDVNGDGFSDIIAGAPQYDNGEENEGSAFLYHGNDGDGLDRIPRQARADGSAPIDLLGTATLADGFRLRASGRSPFGRDLVRLEWEVKPLATPFDGAGIQTSAYLDTGAPGASGGFVPLDELQSTLPAPGPYHWRLRLRSRSAFPWQSHGMGMPYNNLTETDLRVPVPSPVAPDDLGNVLRAVARDSTGLVELTWTSSDPAVVAFHLRRGTAKAASFPLHPTAGDLPLPGYSDAVLGDAMSYYYKVSGLNCAQVEGP